MMKNFAKKLLVAAGIAAAGFAAYVLFSDDKRISVSTSTENGQAAEGVAIDTEFKEVKAAEEPIISSLNPSVEITEPVSEETSHDNRGCN